MIKRTLFFTNPLRLSVQHSQLVVETKNKIRMATIPIEDIGFVLIDNMQISLSLPLVEALVANNAAIVFCDSKHYPQSMLLNLEGNNTLAETVRNQINASVPLKKRLWQQCVMAKIANQAAMLHSIGKKNAELFAFAKNVKSGDPDNREGAAARIYWSRMFYEGFTRERFGKYPNNLLNYGYMVLRAAVARALVGSGLLPVLGIHHHNKYNAYGLADDIMEPYRPFVDRIVHSIWIHDQNREELDKEQKAELLKVLTVDVVLGKIKRPLMLALSQTTASLAHCLAGDATKLKCPVFQNKHDTT